MIYFQESPYFLYNLCVNEVCKAGNNSDTVKCEYSGRFAQSCAALDVIVFWRSSNFCRMYIILIFQC